jgi:ribosomal protein L31E
VDGPKSMAVLKEIERHFGKDIVKLDAEVNSF